MEAGGSGAQGDPQLHLEFNTSLDHMRPFLSWENQEGERSLRICWVLLPDRAHSVPAQLSLLPEPGVPTGLDFSRVCHLWPVSSSHLFLPLENRHMAVVLCQAFHRSCQKGPQTGRCVNRASTLEDSSFDFLCIGILAACICVCHMHT